MKYLLLKAESSEELNTKVNEHLSAGAMLYGMPIIVNSAHVDDNDDLLDFLTFAQAVTMKDG